MCGQALLEAGLAHFLFVLFTKEHNEALKLLKISHYASWVHPEFVWRTKIFFDNHINPPYNLSDFISGKYKWIKLDWNQISFEYDFGIWYYTYKNIGVIEYETRRSINRDKVWIGGWKK